MTCGWTRSRKATVLLALAASIAMALGMDGPAGLSTRDSDGTAGSPTATRPATQPVDDVWVNPFLAEGQWYKANLHSHTSVSDGPATPAERAEQYRRARYSILALTDHSHTQNDLGRLGDANFLVLNGVELSATGGYRLQRPEGMDSSYLRQAPGTILTRFRRSFAPLVHPVSSVSPPGGEVRRLGPEPLQALLVV